MQGMMMVARECQLGLLQEKRISSYLSSLDDDDDELVTAILLLYVVHLYHVRRRDRKWTRDSSLPSNLVGICCWMESPRLYRKLQENWRMTYTDPHCDYIAI